MSDGYVKLLNGLNYFGKMCDTFIAWQQRWIRSRLASYSCVVLSPSAQRPDKMGIPWL